MKIHLKKNHDGSFIPADEESSEWCRKKKTGAVIHADFKQSRNYKHHKKYFGMLKLAYDNQEQYKSFDMLREALQIAAGHCELIQTLDGRQWVKAKTINFASMDQKEFEKLYSDVLDILVQHFGFGEEFQTELIVQFG